MKKHISIFALLLSAFAAVGLSAFAASSGSDVMRLSPIGYRLGATGDVRTYDSSVVAVTPGDTSIVTSNKLVTLTAVLNRDYKVIRWQKFDVDPTVRTEVDPIEEFGEKRETVSVDFNPNVTWMYVTVVVKYDPVRTVKASLSSFGKGKVTVDPEKTSYQKGDVVTLTAEPAEGCSFVRWSDGNADHVRTLTVDGDVDIKAYIEPISSKVTFGVESDAVLDMTSKRVSYGCEYGELPTPTRYGYIFAGWVTAAERSPVRNTTTVAAKADQTFVATWDSVKYAIDYSTAGPGNGRVDGAGQYVLGSTPTLTAIPYEGSAFTGWGDGETKNPRRITVLSNAVYVANFDIATYSVTFTYRDSSGEERTTDPQIVKYGEAATPPTGYDSWPDHAFKAWSTEEYKKVMRDLEIKAIYDEVICKVSFSYRDHGGNVVTNYPQNIVSGKAATPPGRDVVDNWTGHTFRGWDSDYTVIKADCVINALYDEDTFEVVFHYKDSTGADKSSAPQTVKYGAAATPPSDHDEWPVHKFTGWSTEDWKNVTQDLDVFANYEGLCAIVYKDVYGKSYTQGDVVEGQVTLMTRKELEALPDGKELSFKKLGYTIDEKTLWRDATNAPYANGQLVTLAAGQTLELTAQNEKTYEEFSSYLTEDKDHLYCFPEEGFTNYELREDGGKYVYLKGSCRINVEADDAGKLKFKCESAKSVKVNGEEVTGAGLWYEASAKKGINIMEITHGGVNIYLEQVSLVK